MIEEVIQYVCQTCGVSRAALLAKGRQNTGTTNARHLAWWILNKFFKQRPHIIAAIWKTCGSTIHNGITRLEGRMIDGLYTPPEGMEKFIDTILESETLRKQLMFSRFNEIEAEIEEIWLDWKLKFRNATRRDPIRAMTRISAALEDMEAPK